MIVLIHPSFNEGPLSTINLGGLKYGYLPLQRYAPVGVAAHNFGKGFADRILRLRPDWTPFKL